MGHATYRKHNDGSICKSTYHRGDGTNTRSILLEDLKQEFDEALTKISYEELVEAFEKMGCKVEIIKDIQYE